MFGSEENKTGLHVDSAIITNREDWWRIEFVRLAMLDESSPTKKWKSLSFASFKKSAFTLTTKSAVVCIPGQ